MLVRLIRVLSNLSCESSVTAMAEEGQNQPRVPPKRIKLQEVAENSEDDRISALPDCLLLEILSRLPYTKDAIGTGTLSKRWKHLWTLLPTLIFKHNDNHHRWYDFVSFVGKTLTQCRQLKLKKFEVFTSYYVGLDSRVNNWIRYAIRCNVEELNLVLCDMECGAEFLLDQLFFTSSCFTSLRLAGCMFDPTGEIIWKNLRSLCISYAQLDEDLIENILCGSPLLETLELGDCYGYRLLNITSKSVKNLVFSGYDDLSDIIEINAPNILSLTIQGPLLLWKLLLLNVSSLVEAYLNYIKIWHYETTHDEEMLKEFILNLRHVKELKIGVICSKVLSRLEAKGFVVPSNVKLSDGFCEGLEQGDSSDLDSVESGDQEVLVVDHGCKGDEGI